jgi:predicted transcriptional regulator
MVKNERGQVALKRLRQGQKLVKLSNGRAYVFIPRNNISLAWVEEGDVPRVMAVKLGCCGGTKQQFFYATETDIKRWNFGGR